MAEKKSNTRSSSPLFGKENYMWMIIGVVVIMIGFLLMAGGKNDDVNVFKEDEVYSKMRITVAPIVILLGFCLEIVAIFRKPKA